MYPFKRDGGCVKLAGGDSGYTGYNFSVPMGPKLLPTSRYGI